MKNYKILFYGNVVSSCLVIFLGNTLLVSGLFWPPGKVPWIRVCSSFCPEVFLRLVPFFLKFSMMFGTHVAESAFLKKLFLFQKWEKWAKNEPEIGFFEFTGIFSRLFFMNLVYNESLYYLLYSCTNLHLKLMKKTDFFAWWYSFMEIKSWLKNIGAWSEMGVATLVSGL